MDKNYLSRMAERKDIMRSHTSTVLQAYPESISAVNELYTFLFSTYLPQKFPSIFILSEASLYNTATSTSIPLMPSSDPIETLSRIGENIDDDFLFLLKADDGDGYMLKAFVTCFPNGFDTEKKLGLKLREIHGPVPGYKEKLEMSMDRFFDKLEVGKVVSRANVRFPCLHFVNRFYKFVTGASYNACFQCGRNRNKSAAAIDHSAQNEQATTGTPKC